MNNLEDKDFMRSVKKGIKLVMSKMWQRKLSSLILLLLLTVTSNFSRCVSYIYGLFGFSYDIQSMILAMLINSVIGVPYSQEPPFRNDSENIYRMPYEEWMELPYKEVGAKIDFVNSKGWGNLPLLSTKEAQKIISIRVADPTFTAFDYLSPATNSLCQNPLTCDLMTISVQNYILDKPELLKDIIKIAERPCDYIREAREVKPGDEIAYYVNAKLRGVVFAPVIFTKKETEELMTISKKVLGCNNKTPLNKISFVREAGLLFPRKFIMIVINESGQVKKQGFAEEGTVNILVKRKDI
jgi:hypothetical protein